MSTHETQDKPFVYRHYRCRSHSGGRPPCKGVAFPAFEIEKCVAGMLADPAMVEEGADLTSEDRHKLRCLQAAWTRLDLQAQRTLLSDVVEQILFDESDSTLKVRLNTDAVRRIIT